MKLSKRDLTADRVLKIYDLYMQTHQRIANSLYTSFKIYLSFNSGAVVSVGFLVKQFYHQISWWVPFWMMMTTVAFAGWYLSLQWRKTAVDSKRWQLFIDEQITEYETNHLPDDIDLYRRILHTYKSTIYTTSDVMDINPKVARFFIHFWVVGIGISLAMLLLTSIKGLIWLCTDDHALKTLNDWCGV